MVNLKGHGLKGLLTLIIKVLHCWVQLNYVISYYLTHPHANARDKLSNFNLCQEPR